MKNNYTKQIKSYVLRQGHMSPAQKDAMLTLWPIYGLTLSNELLNFKKIFSREAPIILEIGFGNGDILIYLAQLYPEKNFIGIDVHKPGVGALLIKLKNLQLSNVKIFCTDAVEVIKRLASNSLEAVYLLFPDPWQKRRHFKRRLIQSSFIELIHQKLITGGKFHLATDWEDYAHQIFTVVSQNTCFKLISTTSERPSSKFEIRGKKLGHFVWDFVFEKLS